MSAPRVVLTRHMPPPAADLLTDQGYHVDELDHASTPTRADVLTNIAGASGVITMLSECVDEEFLAAAGDNLRIVANYAVGFDNIDLGACRARGIRVSNTPGVLTNATADLAWSLILAAARHVSEGDRVMRRGQWPGWCPTELLGLELSGATLGIVGAGRIGSRWISHEHNSFRKKIKVED
ncbi:MAG: D-glycerate dehydrogenase, partial [Phycisphaerae bacterium]|nr:D-glycerate dehydrogenase [Phycisphaerae bacterium]